jgi:hypothetical protein
MSYKIAGIDVHKKMLAVVVSDVEVDDEYRTTAYVTQSARRNQSEFFGSAPIRRTPGLCREYRTLTRADTQFRV